MKSISSALHIVVVDVRYPQQIDGAAFAGPPTGGGVAAGFNGLCRSILVADYAQNGHPCSHALAQILKTTT
jgi:hypothetical protein